jgi:REP element-mobilizing transposase RayT
MIKDRPHRLDLTYIKQPLYFVTFATRDRKTIPSFDGAQAALEKYARRARESFNVALGRYVIMPDLYISSFAAVETSSCRRGLVA